MGIGIVLISDSLWLFFAILVLWVLLVIVLVSQLRGLLFGINGCVGMCLWLISSILNFICYVCVILIFAGWFFARVILCVTIVDMFNIGLQVHGCVVLIFFWGSFFWYWVILWEFVEDVFVHYKVLICSSLDYLGLSGGLRYHGLVWGNSSVGAWMMAFCYL